MSANSHAHDASKWDAHASKWSSAVQTITLAPCTSLLDQVNSTLSFDGTPDASVLDNGAGSGMMSSILREKYPRLPVTAADVSKGMLDTLREKHGNIETKVLNAEDLKGLNDGQFSHVVCTFMVNFLADAAKGVAEMARVARPGGVVGIANWSRVSWVPVWEGAVRRTEGGDGNYKAPSLFHVKSTETEGNREMMQAAGLTEVELRDFDCWHPEKTPEEAMEEFYGMGNPTTKLMMEGFDEEFVEKSKVKFREVYAEIYAGGRKRQKEIAIIMVGRVPA